MKKILLLSCTMLLLFFAQAQNTGDYRSNASGNWNATSTWERYDGTAFVTASITPTSNDGVITIKTGHTVTVNTAVTADQIVVDAGGTLTQTSNLTLDNGAGDDLTVNGTWNWQNAIISGPGNVVISAAGILTFATGSTKRPAADITNNGTINWQDGNIDFNDFKTITNNAAMTITGNNAMQQAIGGAGIFVNNGTITKASTGTTQISIPTTNNTGTFNCNAGTVLLINNTFTNTGSLIFNSGTLTLSSNVTFNHNTGSVISGTGNFNHNAGTLNLNINQVFPATLVFTSTGIINGAGNLTINHDFTIQGNISGAGSFTVAGNITWNFGILTRALIIDAGRILTFATASQKGIAGDITNNGITNWQDGDIAFWDFKTFTNNATLTISSNNEMSQGIGGAGILINNGIITKTSTGTSTVSIPTTTNIGTFNSNAGITRLGNGFGNPLFTNTGNLTLNNSTFSIMQGATFNHNTGSVISGTGNFNNNGTLQLNINQVFPATIIFASTNTISGAGDLTINNDFTIQGNVSGGNLTINANTTWVGTNLSRIFTNQAGRTFTISGAGIKRIIANLTNNGTMDWQDGTMRYEGPATVTNNGSMTISGNNNFEFAISGVTLINNGTITKTSTGTTQLDIPFINNTGTFNCNGGTLLNFGDTFTNTGSLVLNIGAFTLSGGRTFSNHTGGIIKGNGTVTMNGTFNSNGIIAPGLSPGIITMNGAQPLSANSTLQIEILNGSGAGTGHDQLIRAGNLTLAGTLTVTETGTVPAGTYTILNLTSGAVSGSFASVNLPACYTLLVNASNVQVVKAAPPATPTITAGGATTFCAGGSVTLTSSTATTYLWSNGATTQSINVTASGIFTLTTTNASGCISAASLATTVTVNALPAKPTISAGGATTFCQGGSVVLTSSTASGNTWSTGATTQSITVSAGGSYTVTKTNGSGCSTTSNVTIVTVNSIPAKPTISSSGSTANVCPGKTVTLSSSAGTTYLWNTGATTQSIVVSAAGNYSVSVSNISGCISELSDLTSVTYASCGKATNLTVSNIQATSVRLSWSPVTCAVGYQYEGRVKGTYLWTVAQTNQTSPTITGLSPATIYQWRVITACKIVPDTLVGGYTTVREFTTLSSTALATGTNQTNELRIGLHASVWPNPVHQIATVSVKNNTGKIMVALTDMQGRTLALFNTSAGNQFTIDMSKYTSGMYLVIVKDNLQTLTLKLVKE